MSVATVTPRYLAGYNAVNAASVCAADLPHLVDLQVTQLDNDIVLWGQPVWNAPDAGTRTPVNDAD